MTMQPHIRRVCKAANFSLHKIGRIRKYLDQASAERLVHAFVSSRLDMNNGILYGLPENAIAPLQRVQNTAARVICRKRRYEHITPTLKALHWLPVRSRIEFKILLMCFKALNGLAPGYLASMLRFGTSERLTRSCCSERLLPPRSRTKFGDRSFRHAAPTLWNKLPSHIKEAQSVNQFKRLLKSFLFNSK